jgi:hypothetical protein
MLIAVDVTPSNTMTIDGLAGDESQYVFIESGTAIFSLSRENETVIWKRTFPSGTTPPHALAGYGSGDNYVVTDEAAEVVRGTDISAVIIPQPGVYKFSAAVLNIYDGAKFTSGDIITLGLQRTNNTPGAIPGSMISYQAIVGATEAAFDGSHQVSIPHVLYETGNTDDRIALYIGLNNLPAQGTLEVTSDFVFIERLR